MAFLGLFFFNLRIMVAIYSRYFRNFYQNLLVWGILKYLLSIISFLLKYQKILGYIVKITISKKCSAIFTKCREISRKYWWKYRKFWQHRSYLPPLRYLTLQQSFLARSDIHQSHLVCLASIDLFAIDAQHGWDRLFVDP